jgi:hypothetical protein
MIALLSPALRMRPSDVRPESEPAFFAEAASLCAALRSLTPHRLESVLGINDVMALRAYGYLKRFDISETGTAAAFGLMGLCYAALDPGSFDADSRAFIQRHLRIASAFYGLMRPMDNMLPHRLEMSTKGIPGIPDLYAFWGERPCRALYDATDCVVSLCSREYEAAFLPHVRPGRRFVRCEFLVPVNGKLQMKATQVKMARGRMARFIVENSIDDPRELAGFDWDGYAFMPYRSHDSLLVFGKQIE